MNIQELIIKSDADLDAMLYATTWIEKETKEMERDKTWLSKVLNEFDKPKKVVIPKFAAEWIEKAKEAEYPLAYAINQTSGELGKWLHTYDLTVDIRKNQELFAKAWVNGYEVEKEKLYRIILPERVSKKWTYCFIDRDLEVQYTHVLSAVTTHTEEQIEAYDEIYQELAVEVTE